MSQSYTGGCMCGALRYAIAAEPMAMLDCYCRQCQRESGTSHASHLTWASRAGLQLSGTSAHWDLVGDGGVQKRRHFCPHCGAPVYMTFPQMPEMFAVRAASLDEPARYCPQMQVWTAAAPPWARLDAKLPAFDKMPPMP